MEKLQRSDLYSLEQYAEMRNDFRAKMIQHKKLRHIDLGSSVRLLFEDRQIMQYQIQEMLRIEKIFEPAGIQEELDAYNPLIPDGSNLKATMMIEISDIEERKVALKKLLGIEKVTWLKIADHDKVFPIANEDMDRETEEKTSSVHFLRFELTPEMITALKNGADLSAGIDHPEYNYEISVDQNVSNALINDLD